ncbi:MAG: hypothetical protein JXB32_15550 [Deltaproteobacteria bacterium]|nr:hypothetical protein [Deltaproteobacteria bacterium]
MSHVCRVLVLAVWLVPVGIAAAQPAAEAAEAAEPVVVEPAAVEPAAVEPAVDPVLQEAGERFDRGVTFYDEGDFGAALAEFLRAYELTGHWGVLYNLGQVSSAMNRHVDSVRYFEGYLTDGGSEIEAPRRAEVEEKLGELRSRLATVTVTVDVAGAEVLLDDEIVGTTPLTDPIWVAAGPHVVVARHPEHGSERRSLTLASQMAETVAFELVQPVVEPPPVGPVGPVVGQEEEWSIAEQWWFWTILGVVVAGGAATAGVLLAEPTTVYTSGTVGTVDLGQYD